MTDTDPDFEALENEWERLFLAKRWEDLIEATIAAKIELSKRHAFDSRQIEAALGWLRLAIGQVEEAKIKSSPECSFCGKTPPAIKLGAGPSAFICNECVALFTDVWKEDEITARLPGDNASKPG